MRAKVKEIPNGKTDVPEMPPEVVAIQKQLQERMQKLGFLFNRKRKIDAERKKLDEYDKSLEEEVASVEAEMDGLNSALGAVQKKEA
jgi:hypothetical protein